MLSMRDIHTMYTIIIGYIDECIILYLITIYHIERESLQISCCVVSMCGHASCSDNVFMQVCICRKVPCPCQIINSKYA